MIDIVSATRHSEADFWKSSALGISLQRVARDGRFRAHVAFENRRGLPAVYNARIDADDASERLIFVHDDVWLDDYFVAHRVVEGLEAFDVIGVAGNRRRIRLQPAWMFPDASLARDDARNLSGAVAHAKHPFGPVSFFGSTPAECELLDGAFLAAKRDTLRAHRVRFDERFDFHFYDMDFCRTARQQGLRLGTWPISLTHQSGGAFGNLAWIDKYESYLAKWEK